MRAQAGPLLRVLREGERGAGERRARGLVPGDGEEQEEEAELGRGQGLPVEVGREQLRRDVVGRATAGELAALRRITSYNVCYTKLLRSGRRSCVRRR